MDTNVRYPSSPRVEIWDSLTGVFSARSSLRFARPVLRLVMALSPIMSLIGLLEMLRLRTLGTKASRLSSESRLVRLLCSYEMVMTWRRVHNQ